MSTIDIVRKARRRAKEDRDLLSDETVKPVLSITKENGNSGVAQLEIVLLEGALEDLHRHRNQIRSAGRNAVKAKRSETKKFYRAVAKTYIKTRMTAPDIVMKSRQVTIPEYKRQDGTVVAEHTRRLPEGHSAREVQEREEIIDEMEEALRYQGEQTGEQSEALDDDYQPTTFRERAEYSLGRVDELAGEFLEGDSSETYHGAISAFLNESSVGRGISAVAGFFADQGSKFQFAARAISEFGPWAGTRLAYNYFRYGGYDVPMSEKNGKVVTEMGDTLPEIKSQKESRKWAIEMLRKRLPGQSAEDSEAEPPSEGFLIDDKGNVLAHGVGRGNDHFLPFNAKHLKQMREHEGVEYVRRRMYGGPTVEDMHAAMMMGADRLTVVSNGGEFTVDLTHRSHGLKMEHMQVLGRYQQILDQKFEESGLDFSGYNSALDTLEAEFPLHFKKAFAKAGDWDEREDRIQPQNRFVDGLREIFTTLAGGEYTGGDYGQRGGSSNRTTGPRPGGSDLGAPLRGRTQHPERLPWRSQGLTQKEWLERETQKRSYSEVMGQLVNSYSRAGYETPKWAREARDRARDADERRRRTGSTDQRSAAQRALGPPDGAKQAAQSAQPQSARFTMPQRARQRFEELGLDPAGYTTENTAHARELAQLAHELPGSMWEESLESRDFLNDLRDTFGNITRP